ncbi:MAG: hypothetical protein ACRCVN_02260 [Spirochaetia bacterium]
MSETRQSMQDRLARLSDELRTFDQQSEELFLQFADRLSDLLETLKRQVFLWKEDCLERGQHFQQAFCGLEELISLARTDAVYLIKNHINIFKNVTDGLDEDRLERTFFMDTFFKPVRKEFVKMTTLLEGADITESPRLTDYRLEVSRMIQHMEEYAEAACKLATGTSESVMFAIQEVQFQDLLSQSIGHIIHLMQDYSDYVDNGGNEGATFCLNIIRLAYGILEDIETVLQDANVIFIQQVFIVERFFLRIDGQQKKLYDDVALKSEDEQDISGQMEEVLGELAIPDRSYLNYLASKTKILNTYFKFFQHLQTDPAWAVYLLQSRSFIAKLSDQITSEYTLYEDARQSASEGLVDIFGLTKNLMNILTEGEKEIADRFGPKVDLVRDDATSLEKLCTWIALLKDKMSLSLTMVMERNKEFLAAGEEDDWAEKKQHFHDICEKFTIVAHKQIGAEIAGFDVDEGMMSGDVVLF